MSTANSVTDPATGRLLGGDVRIDCGTTPAEAAAVRIIDGPVMITRAPSRGLRMGSRDGRHTLSAAEGVLAVLRRCSLEEAFADIVGMAKRHNVAPLRLAGALVARAQGDPALETDHEAGGVVTDCWGHLLSPR